MFATMDALEERWNTTQESDWSTRTAHIWISAACERFKPEVRKDGGDDELIALHASRRVPALVWKLPGPTAHPSAHQASLIG